MKHVQAALVLGLSGWLSYLVYTGAFVGTYASSTKTRFLNDIIVSATDRFGQVQTAVGLAAAGLLLAILLMRRKV